jgi:hypothetical protein
METLNNKEILEISGGTTDLGEWLVNKIGDFFCSCKNFTIDTSLMKNYSHGTYPGSYNY